ncbi:MAG: hypothetical protein RLZZ562_725 [Planctomycetota bacterium]
MPSIPIVSALALLAPLAAQVPLRVFDHAPTGQAAGNAPWTLGRTSRPGEVLVALDDGVRGLELWATDGTPSGTRFVFEFVGGPGGAVFHSSGSQVAATLFVVDRGLGLEMWQSDGTTNGTRLLFSAARLGVAFLEAPQVPFQIGGQWVFNADSDLWISDGTFAGTAPVLMQTAQGLFRMPAGYVLSTFGGRFHIQHQTLGVSVFAPGSTLPFVSLLGSPATFELLRDEPMVVQNAIGAGPGSPTTTTVTAIYRPGSPSHVFQGFGRAFALGNGVGFVDDSMRLLHWDLVNAPVQLHAATTGGLLFLGSRWLFDGSDPATGSEPWVTDGTLAGTRPLDLTPGPASTSFAFVGADQQGRFGLLWRRDTVTGMEPWVTDGTVAGTRMLADLEPGPGDSQFDAFLGAGAAVGQGRFVMPVQTAARGWELVFTDGTPQGTRHLPEIAPGIADGIPQFSFAPAYAGHRVLFVADDRVTGQDLWSVAVEGSSLPYATHGARSLSVRGNPLLGTSIEFASDRLQASDLGAVAVGLPAAQATQAGANATWLFVDLAQSLPYLLIAPDPQGAWRQSVAVPNDAALQGVALVAQAGFAGPTIPGGVELATAWWLCLGR